VGFGLKNMGSAQLDILALEEPAAAGREVVYSEPTSDLRQQVAERLAAHRERRSRGAVATGVGTLTERPARSRYNPIAAVVAERFAHSPSYRAFLAEEAQRATEQAAREAESAAAEAEIAARNAQAIAESQQQLLAELELWNAPQRFTAETAQIVDQAVESSPAQPARQRTHAPKVRPAALSNETPSAGFTVRLYEDLGRTLAPRSSSTNAPLPVDLQDAEEAQALDDEIAFRQSPVFEPFSIEPPTPLAANLLEFPRQLIAARKARPRLAEGPLRDESSPRSPQLRIFEVEAEQISTVPAPVSITPEWASIRLDAQTNTEPVVDLNSPAPALLPSMLPPQTAPLSLRVMATTVDGSLVAAAFLAFAAVAARVANRIPTGIPAVIATASTLAVFYLVYQLLFFTFSDQTPGMRYARIGLCTLADENPTRSAMRRRVLAQIVAVCPFGLGILWALLDDDGLGWHDRISRMYQRAY
jgi:uncharacterized RDD family membrane protein YckC